MWNVIKEFARVGCFNSVIFSEKIIKELNMSDVEGDDVPVAATAPIATGPMDINTAIQV